jgi:hypothetical protein
VQGILDLKPRSSSQVSFAYDPPDEMPADGELTATPGRRPELLIWADDAHTRWQLTASRIETAKCARHAAASAVMAVGPPIGSFHRKDGRLPCGSS